MGRLSAFVLGAAAGGGFPQWNCNCDVCRLAWAGDPRVKPRTQASIAVTAGPNGSAAATDAPFVVVNASPDLRQQIIATPALQPRGLRMSPIAAVVLTGGEVDQTAGLLTLRERGPFGLYGTEGTLSTLAANSIFSVLAADVVPRKAIRPGTSFELPGGIEAELFLVPGKAPLYLEGGDRRQCGDRAACRWREAGLHSGCRQAHARDCGAPCRCRCRAVRRHVVYRRRDDRGRRRGKDRSSHGPHADQRTGRYSGSACRPRAAPHPDPHQQYQSDPGRRFAAATRRRSGGFRSR